MPGKSGELPTMFIRGCGDTSGTVACTSGSTSCHREENSNSPPRTLLVGVTYTSCTALKCMVPWEIDRPPSVTRCA